LRLGMRFHLSIKRHFRFPEPFWFERKTRLNRIPQKFKPFAIGMRFVLSIGSDLSSHEWFRRSNSAHAPSAVCSFQSEANLGLLLHTGKANQVVIWR
jgi:hypothetical protein